MPQSFFGTTQFPLDVLHVKTTNILQFDTFEQIPNAFLRIELRSIGRQAFEMNTFGSAVGQEIFDCFTAMNGRTIPDDQQLAGDFTQEDLQKASHIVPLVRVVLRLHEDPSFWSNATNGRKMVSRQFDVQDRRLSDRGIRPNRHWQQIKRRLIYKDECPIFVFGLFFSCFHCSSCHVWIAISSRCVAFWMGFC